MVGHCGVLLGPRQRLHIRGRRCGHQPASPRDAPLAVGNFNADFAVPEGRTQDEDITTDMARAGLEDLSRHFFPWHKPWLRDSRTWFMRHEGREVCSYILVTYRCLLQNMVVRDARHNRDHYLILDCLRGATPTTNSCYLGKCTRFPIKPPTTVDDVDSLFAEIQLTITKPTQQDRLRQALISPEFYCLIDTWIAACLTGDHWITRGFNRLIKASFQEDQHQRASKAGSTVESSLASAPPLIQEVWIWMQVWYRGAVDRLLLPSIVAIATMTEDWVALY